MPKRKKDLDLPKRLHFKHGSYFYVFSADKKLIWRNLGKDKVKAIATANEINNLSRVEKQKVREMDAFVIQVTEEFVLGRDGYKCTYCGSEENLGMAHVIPVVRGGSSQPFNLVACCHDCNFQKNDDNPIIFLLKRKGFFEHIMSEIIRVIRNNTIVLDTE